LLSLGFGFCPLGFPPFLCHLEVLAALSRYGNSSNLAHAFHAVQLASNSFLATSIVATRLDARKDPGLLGARASHDPQHQRGGIRGVATSKPRAAQSVTTTTKARPPVHHHAGGLVALGVSRTEGPTFVELAADG
jgi:hypothetical protein